MTSHSDGPKGPNQPRPKRRRKPHNAKPIPDYLCLAEMIEAIATEELLVHFAAGNVMMSRRERSFRIMIEKAFDGQVREPAQLLRLMAKYPELSATVIQVTVIRGGLCDV